MKPSHINVEQGKKILKAGLYVSLSALIDYFISQTQGTQFGTLTPLINVILVSIKQVFTQSK